MSQNAVPHSRILLIGLEPQLSMELSILLSSEGHVVEQSQCSDVRSDHLRRPNADLIFCASSPQCFEPLQQLVRRTRAGIPIIVVSRHPEVTEWLDAIEHGAADYCAAPFEPVQIRWILESNLPRRRSAVA
jgi:DNA-binding response OmpR family regulator